MNARQLVKESSRIDSLERQVQKLMAQQAGRDLHHSASPQTQFRSYDLWMDVQSGEMLTYLPTASNGHRTPVGWASTTVQNISLVPVAQRPNPITVTTGLYFVGSKNQFNAYVVETFGFIASVAVVGGGQAWGVNDYWRLDFIGLFSTPAATMYQVNLFTAGFPADGNLNGHNYPNAPWTFSGGWGMYVDVVRVGNPPPLTILNGYWRYRHIRI